MTPKPKEILTINTHSLSKNDKNKLLNQLLKLNLNVDSIYLNKIVIKHYKKDNMLIILNLNDFKFSFESTNECSAELKDLLVKHFNSMQI